MTSKVETYTWYALRTLPHKERYVSVELDIRGFEHYIPVYRFYFDKNKYKDKILISSYVFVKADEKQLGKLHYIPGSKGILMYDGKPAIVKDNEIDLLRKICGELDFDPELNTLIPGDRVKIINGVLKGQIARVCECQDKKLGIEIMNSNFTIWINSKGLIYELLK